MWDLNIVLRQICKIVNLPYVSESIELGQCFIFHTCDGIHLLLRWSSMTHDLSDWREGDAGVQVQAQHEVMHLVTP